MTDIVDNNEFQNLKNEAKLLGMRFSPNIGIDTLKAKLDEFKKQYPNLTTQADIKEEQQYKIQDNYETLTPQNIKQEATKLIRIKISNLDPDEKDLRGNIFTVSNKYFGTIRRYVPFQSPEADSYHVENCIYKLLLNAKYVHKSVRDDNKNKSNSYIKECLKPKFNIQVLEPLTREQLDELASIQAAARQLETDSQD